MLEPKPTLILKESSKIDAAERTFMMWWICLVVYAGGVLFELCCFWARNVFMRRSYLIRAFDLGDHGPLARLI